MLTYHDFLFLQISQLLKFTCGNFIHSRAPQNTLKYFRELESTSDGLGMYFIVLDTDYNVLGATSMYFRSTFSNFKYLLYSAVLQVQKFAVSALH